MPNITRLPTTLHLPPHLREVCAILAAGLLRLRSRTAEEFARDAEQGRGSGDVRLHSTGKQRRHADSGERELA